MKSQSISLRDANQNFSRVIAAVEQGEMFSITRRGREVARLLPASPDARASRISQDGASSGADALAEGRSGEPTLVERVLRLEARLDKLAASLAISDTK